MKYKDGSNVWVNVRKSGNVSPEQRTIQSSTNFNEYKLNSPTNEAMTPTIPEEFIYPDRSSAVRGKLYDTIVDHNSKIPLFDKFGNSKI